MSRIRANSVTDMAGTGTPSLPYGIQVGTGATVRGDTNTITALTNGSERVRIDDNGNVGVGTIPSNFLDNATSLEVHSKNSVNTFFALTNSTTGGDGLVNGFNIIMSNEEGRLFNRENGPLTFWTNSSVRACITAAGNVGIGITEPAYKLSVLTTGTTDTLLHLATSGGASSNGDATNSIRFTGGTNTRWANAKYESYSHIFNTNGVERVRIASGGNLGIGTANPERLLHVQASNANASSNAFDVAILEKNDDCYLKILSANDKVGGINFGDTQGSFMGAIQYNHDGNNLIFNVNEEERVRITSTGDVGIGTANPTSNGGTTLEIYNATTPTLRLNDGGDYKALFQLRGNDLEIRGSSGIMEFYTGNADGASSTERMVLTSGGDLKIGSGFSTSTSTGYGIGNIINSTADKRGGKLQIQADGTNTIYVDVFEIYNGSQRTAHFKADGNLVIGRAGSGIDFTAQGGGSGSAESNLLNDYEQGTWTPNIIATTSAWTGSLSAAQGIYVKTGRQVWCHCRINWINAGGSGNIRIGNFPFSVEHGGEYETGVNVSWYQGINQTGLSGYVVTTDDNMMIVYDGTDSALNLTVSDLDSTGWLYADFLYLED